MANAIDRGAVNVAKILIPASIIDHSYKVLSILDLGTDLGQLEDWLSSCNQNVPEI